MWQALWRLAAGNPFNITANDIGLPTSTKTVSGGFSAILAALMGVIGGLALIFMVVGGLQYVLSAGDPKRTAQAKETLLYSAVGIIVAVAGYALVVFVIGVSNGTSVK